MDDWREFLAGVAETIRVERDNPRNAEKIKAAWEYIESVANGDGCEQCMITEDK